MATPEGARRVEVLSDDRTLAEELERRRAAIRKLVPEIAAARSRPTAPLADDVGRAMAEWEGIRAIYRRMASTTQVRAQLDRQLERALGEHSHH